MIGELAVFDKKPRSASIVTRTKCTLLHIPRAALFSLLHRDNELTLALLKDLSIRLRDAGTRQERVDQIVRAYRERGHVKAKLDPLGLSQGEHHELDLDHYGFDQSDLKARFSVKLGKETSRRSLGDIIAALEAMYCRHVGAQYRHIDNPEIQEWIRVRLESQGGNYHMAREEQLRTLKKLTDAEVFENFLHTKFIGKKRFSLEGSESLIPLLDYAIDQAGSHGVDEVIIGMAHRGRLNVLVHIMDKPARQIFREFLDTDPEVHAGRGDVKYHLGYSCDRVTSSGHKVHLSLCFNPSHLGFVGPVVLGRTRAKQDRYGDEEKSRALPLLIHGDAAFIGEGTSQELFNMSELPGYGVGGTVHVVLNNQIGFTTNPDDSRTSHYSTDIARMLQIPIFHVNGEQPEAVAMVIRLAMDFRERFKKDVVIDMYGYRKYGHNEGDDPVFTQPLLYKRIKRRRSVRRAFVENLLELGDISQEEADNIASESKDLLEQELEASKLSDYKFQRVSSGRNIWSDFLGGPDHKIPEVDTSYPKSKLVTLLKAMGTHPEGFTPYSKIERFQKAHVSIAEGEAPLNWGAGESLAFASLLAEKVPVRLSGQDSERGTFSHRHAVWYDVTDGKSYTPLNNLAQDQAQLDVYNSPLTETAVLGFEYGYSLDMPDGLVIWEAQFGDFCNVAQVIIDQFISSSEDKWRRLSGITLFLPHGFEGQGPEHSSARLERFLMLSAEDNIQVVNLTTPAQLFHCLRRQVLRKARKPLIVMSPKSLLRHPKATSTLEDCAEGAFHKVLADQETSAARVNRVVICSGKIYYELAAAREEEGVENVAIIRLEQYYPLPSADLETVLKPYKKGTPVIWVQEEPLNMGAWPFLKLRFGETIDGNGSHPLTRVTRPESASPATGSEASHKIEQKALIREALGLAEAK